MQKIDIQFGLVHDCMRACVYGGFLAKERPTKGAWPSLMDICYSDAIITWNQLFGVWSQETHWSKFDSQLKIPQGDKLKPFSKEIITDFIKISDNEWEAFHEQLTTTRNTRIAHLNIDQKLESLPNITWALHSAYIYREWLIQVLEMEKRYGSTRSITEQTSQHVQKHIYNEISNDYKGL
jgi:hypothetical protein